MMLRKLKRGVRGEDVRALQQALNRASPAPQPLLIEDADFGGATDRAVRAFQAAKGLQVDGVAGGLTRGRLFPLQLLTLQARAFRLTMPPPRGRPPLAPPNLGRGPLKFPGTPGSAPEPGLSINLLANTVRIPTPTGAVTFGQQRFPGLSTPLAAPPLQTPRPVQLPPLPGLPLLPTNGGLQAHHLELTSGISASVGGAAFAFTFAAQAVVMVGGDKGAHQEFTTGVSFGGPPGGQWTVGWFAQITDVDRIGALGQFHLWQPYAQVGAETDQGAFKPRVTAGVFPLNLTLDVSDQVGVNLAGGSVFSYEPDVGTVVAGQMTAGLIFKLEKDIVRPTR